MNLKEFWINVYLFVDSHQLRWTSLVEHQYHVNDKTPEVSMTWNICSHSFWSKNNYICSFFRLLDHECNFFPNRPEQEHYHFVPLYEKRQMAEGKIRYDPFYSLCALLQFFSGQIVLNLSVDEYKSKYEWRNDLDGTIIIAIHFVIM